MYVLEVKGGRVSLVDGIWHYQDRSGYSTASGEGPFRQAEAALHGLVADIQRNVSADLLDRFTVGYGVVFPDCAWHTRSVEWDEALVADMHGSRNIDAWLNRLFAHWQERDLPREPPDTESVQRLQHYLRPEFIDVQPRDDTARVVEQVSERVETLTEDQMRLVDVAEANPRVICFGGAGTGKTFLAERLARRWSTLGLQVALICRSPWLRHFLASRLVLPRVSVSSIDGARLACRRAGLGRFDAVIVDEGQDLLDPGSVDILDSVLDSGLAQGRWAWFQDLNQSFFPAIDRDMVERLMEADPVRIPLRNNCRNTRVILECVQSSTGADLGVTGAGEGPAVRKHYAANQRDSARLLGSEIVRLVDGTGLAPGRLTIVSPLEMPDSSVGAMSANSLRRIRPLDEFSMRSVRLDKVGFAQIDDFKGLENDAVIVCDLPEPSRRSHSTLHYVAMSRPRAILSVIYRDAQTK